MSVLDDVSHLKELAKEQTDTPPVASQKQPVPDLFLLQAYPNSNMEVLEPIPPRLVVDSIIAQYFQSTDMPVALIIHRGVFLKQYGKFCVQVHILRDYQQGLSKEARTVVKAIIFVLNRAQVS
jgi:hypothetical protein